MRVLKAAVNKALAAKTAENSSLLNSRPIIGETTKTTKKNIMYFLERILMFYKQIDFC